ncbi:rRNA maturation RNase YbeY [Pararhodobacter sp.]|uniref:rRNA maturation RNase YbeY n=1 Tax=Pararhodobacter sp. TaxID=2127056 RepID=UPI002AFEA457|nr:rRNA maturation RNase YbeY [Pararhodobacter sp.]
MHVEIDITDARWAALDLNTLVARASAATLAFLGYDPAAFEVSVLACDDQRIQALNSQFRAKDSATNVLSWPTWDLSAETPGNAPDPAEPGTPEDPEALGDVALAYETCFDEARAQNKTPGDHVTHLVVHSVLHLLGYDHQTDEDAVLMEETERSVLAQLGIADPYAQNDSAMPLGVAALD